MLPERLEVRELDKLEASVDARVIAEEVGSPVLVEILERSPLAVAPDRLPGAKDAPSPRGLLELMPLLLMLLILALIETAAAAAYCNDNASI